MENKYLVGKFGGHAPLNFTHSYQTFASELNHSELLLYYLVALDAHIREEERQEAIDGLINLFVDHNNPVSNYFVDLLKSGLGNQVFKSKTYEPYFCQMAFARSVDNFITYLKEILAEVVIAKPEILKSKDQEKLEFILSFSSYDDLKIAIAEKKIEELFYKGINDIENFFRDRLGVNMFENEKNKNSINQIIKKRNLIVHNRGIISKSFIKEFPDYQEHLSDRLVFSYEDVSLLTNELNNTVVHIDNLMCEKFNLKIIPTPIPYQ